MHSLVASAGSWTPRAYGTDLGAWWRASEGVSLDAGSGKVAAWADQSGNDVDLAQGTDAIRLGYTASGSLGRPALLGNGVGYLDGPATGWVQPATILAVVKFDPSLDWQTILDAHTGGRWIARITPDEQFSIYAGAANIWGTATVTVPSIVIGVLDGASSSYYVSSVTPPTPISGGSPGTGGFGSPRVGAAPGDTYIARLGSEYYDIAVVKRALNAAERAQYFRYARARYGIAVTGL